MLWFGTKLIGRTLFPLIAYFRMARLISLSFFSTIRLSISMTIFDTLSILSDKFSKVCRIRSNRSFSWCSGKITNRPSFVFDDNSVMLREGEKLLRTFCSSSQWSTSFRRGTSFGGRSRPASRTCSRGRTSSCSSTFHTTATCTSTALWV